MRIEDENEDEDEKEERAALNIAPTLTIIAPNNTDAKHKTQWKRDATDNRRIW